MTATTAIHPAIEAFASAVRAALDDLTAEEIDDLTEGLEADLTDQAADTGGEPELGDPVAYANELRTAAGLPVRVKRRRGLSGGLAALRSRMRERVQAMKAHPTLVPVLEFLITLRPVWWVLRGVVLYVVLFLVIRPSGGNSNSLVAWSWVLVIPFIVVSVQWGRARWLVWRWLPAFRTLVSIVAIVAMPFLFGWLISSLNSAAASASASYNNEDPGQHSPPGMQLNGSQITNIFAYDENGELLSDVQLFDQDGNPLMVADEDAAWLPVYSTSVFALVPSPRVPGNAGWNVFPLNEIIDQSQGFEGDVEPANPPFPQVRPLAGESGAKPTPTPQPTDTPTPTP